MERLVPDTRVAIIGDILPIIATVAFHAVSIFFKYFNEIFYLSSFTKKFISCMMDINIAW